MITRSCAEVQSRPAWQTALANAVSDRAELLRLLELPPASVDAPSASTAFRLRVPRPYVARMRKGDPRDPLLRQVLPIDAEDAPDGWGLLDPVGDGDAEVVPGVLHKYHGRVLLVATGACAVHCRYCFRRHFDYGSSNPAQAGWAAALGWLRDHADIREVILSGGDPLSLSDGRLAALSAALEAIPHLSRLRIHTRLPIVLPERVDDELLAWLSRSRLKPVMVLHANHPNELDEAVRAAAGALRAAGVTLLNQAVLLRGVNDDEDALVALSERLYDCGILPYYLHRLDPVRGAGHFAVADEHARALLRALRERLPGYLVPRFVREEPGAPHKLDVI